MTSPESGQAGWNFRCEHRAPRCRPGQPWFFAAGECGKVGNGSSSDPEPDYTREPGQLVLARILLAQDRPGQAFALLGG